MDKEKLVVGKTYLRRRKTVYAGKEVEAESWIKCIQITPAGAVFWSGDNLLKLTDEEIKKEVTAP
ncbi:hypothetical protein [Blautia argi]|uniref:hypothetical protein n=1 Tax=Blautia argi TaxID=1912897 RepID=UPI0029439159|nr:hypothetical protein [Blautia argi]